MLRHQTHKVHEVSLSEGSQCARAGFLSDVMCFEELSTELDEDRISVGNASQGFSMSDEVDERGFQAVFERDGLVDGPVVLRVMLTPGHENANAITRRPTLASREARPAPCRPICPGPVPSGASCRAYRLVCGFWL